MSDWSGAKSHWQFSRWVNNIGRNTRITEPDGDLLAFMRYFVAVFCNPPSKSDPVAWAACTRPWLYEKFLRISGNSVYCFDPATESPANVVKALVVIGRDFKKIPMTGFEWIGVTILLSYAHNAQLGTGPYFGGVIGDGPESSYYNDILPN